MPRWRAFTSSFCATTWGEIRRRSFPYSLRKHKSANCTATGKFYLENNLLHSGDQFQADAIPELLNPPG
jgi:hypothetical protein